MTTPTPYHRELDELLGSLAVVAGAPRRAIVRAVHDLFDSATAKPAPATAPSDTNGSAPELERALFVEPHPAELRIMEAATPNGFDHRAV